MFYSQPGCCEDLEQADDELQLSQNELRRHDAQPLGWWLENEVVW